MTSHSDIPDRPIRLPRDGNQPADAHLFDEGGPGKPNAERYRSIWAVRAALAAGRSLLVRGEPGVGKSQLARAAAAWLGRPFLSFVVNSRTEAGDLLWSFDAVARLAEAQVCGALNKDTKQWLAEANFIHPGKLWWALNWASAKQQADRVDDPTPATPEGWSPGEGCVLLIDEIDKAESDVPNGLLEALGASAFPVRGGLGPVAVEGEPPLVVITTNEERVLPNAFVRRCLVLNMRLPEGREELHDLLTRRGQAHFPECEIKVLGSAADLLIEERNQARLEQVRPLPGQAEYLDLLRAALGIARREGSDPGEVLGRVREYVLKKSAGVEL